MRVLFLTLYPGTAASPRYRVLQYLPYLRGHGVDCTVACALTPQQYARFTGPDRKGRPLWYHLVETPRRLRHLLEAKNYDIVFVQKAITTAYIRGAATLLARRARRVIYDFDDAVHLAPPHPLRSIWKGLEDRAQIQKILAQADLVLAGNSWLGAAAEKEGARTEVFPTVVDTARFVPASAPAAAYRIGWVGNPSTTACLEPVAGVLGSVDGAEVCIVGADPKANLVPNAETRPWSLDTEVEDLQRFAVGIMPLPKTEWMRGKCALKALLYMACGIPCVATPFGAALDVIRHDENGLLADSTEEWRAALERLRDPALRQRLGEAGRATVVERFSLDRAAPRMLELLESVS